MDNKILVYYGDYKIDDIYDINDFLSNLEIDLFKIQQLISTGKKNILRERYVILTDIYFLLFDPVPDHRSYGKLLFWGDIRQLTSSKGSSEHNNNLVLEWKNQEKSVISFELVFGAILVKDFLEIAMRKINKVKETFNIFHDELTRPNSEKKSYDYEKLVLLITFKEDLLEKNKSVNTMKELMNLYQSVIEILSERNDENFATYLKKLKTLMEDPEFQNQLGCNESSIETTDKVIKKDSFELSNSYYSAAHDEDKVVVKDD